MENFDEAAMLHFVRNCLFQPESPLHQEFLISLQQLITTLITHRETEWFPLMSHDLHRLQAANAELQDRLTTHELK